MWDKESKGWDQGSEGWDLGSQPWDQGSQTMGSGSAVFLRDQGSGCAIFVGSGTKFGPTFGIKDQKFAFQIGISVENTYLVVTLICFRQTTLNSGCIVTHPVVVSSSRLRARDSTHC